MVDTKIFRNEICFLLDVTASTKKYIKGVKESIKLLIKDLEKIFSDESIAIGIAGYRDKNDEIPFIKLDFIKYDTENLPSIAAFIDGIIPKGGEDEAEDIKSGIENTLEQLRWFSNKRKFIILIAEAPTHGRRWKQIIRKKILYLF